MNDGQLEPSRHGRRTRITAAAALVIAVAVALYLVLASGSNAGKTASDSSARYSGAATVERRDLVQQDTESGTLGHARSYTVYNRVTGTITWLPSPGDVIKPGQALFRIDNRPVLLMNGTTPAYRDLSASDAAGPDILQLNANLVELGYNPDGIVVDDTWQAATTAAVKELQHDLGEGESGKILLGKVVFLPGKQLVSSVVGSVGSAVSLTGSSSHAEFVSLDTTMTDTTPATSTTETTAATTATTPPTTTPTATTPPATTPAATTPPATTPATATPKTTTPKTTTPPRTTTTTPKTTTPPRTTTTPRSGAGKKKTPATGSKTTPAGSTPTHPSARHGSTKTGSDTTPPSTNSAGGGDNLSQRTLRALLQLVKEQQQALAHQHQGAGTPSKTTPSSPSKAPSSSSESPSTSSSESPSTSSSKSPSTSSSKSPSTSSKHPSSSTQGGGGGGAPTAIMDTTSTGLVVTVDLSPSSQSEAVVGGHVKVELPDGSTVPGTITAVSSVAQSSSSGDAGATGNTGSGGSGSSTVPVTITLDRHVSGKGLDQAAVSVDFVQARANHVLSVPVTALLATSGSTYAVQEAAPPHRLIPVKTGLFAAGYVQISGAGIHPGLRVTDSQG